MDWNETTRTLRIPKIVCDDVEERGVDLDIVLPDYCPDVAAILKYVMDVTVTSRRQSGDRYTVDGFSTVRILYLSEDRAVIHCYEATQPFSVGFRCMGAVHYFVDTKNDYVNCRAISPRRIDIHGAFRIHLLAVSEGVQPVFEDPCRRDVFCKTETIVSTVPMSEYEKTFVVSETVDLGLRVDRLLYTTVAVSSVDQKLLTNKAIIKGILLLKAVYVANNELSTVKQEIPFSQIVDVDGLNEDGICETSVYPCEKECALRQGENGSALLDFSGKLTGVLRCSCRETSSVVMDVYSVEEALELKTTSLRLCDQSVQQHQKHSSAELVSVPSELVAIEDQWCELSSCEFTESGEGKQLEYRVTLCIIGRNAEGQLACYERPLDCRAACEDTVRRAGVRWIDSACTLSGNQIRVQLEGELLCEYGEDRRLMVITDVSADTKRVFTRPHASIRIVYADKGESVWDIAKTHHSSVEEICAENDLTDKTIHTPTMLMIPMI